MSPVDSSLFDSHMAVVRAKRPGGMRLGSDMPQIERIALPSPSLMRITEGGIPCGRTTRLFGPPSSGKTFVAYMVIAAGQQHRSALFPTGLRATLWDIEGVWDEQYGASIGIDSKTMGLQEAVIVEDIAAEMELLLHSCHLHVLDSCSSAKTLDELAAKPEDWLPMIENRAWKRAWRRIEANFDTQQSVIILVDHMSENYKTKARRALGGKVLDHASSMSVELSSGGWLFYHPDGYLEKADKIKEDCGLSPNGRLEPDGYEIHARVAKSRVCRPFRNCTLRLDSHTSKLDTTFELLDAARFFDEDGVPAHRSKKPAIAQRTGPTGKGSHYRIIGHEKPAHGERAVRAAIDGDEGLQELICRAMTAGW